MYKVCKFVAVSMLLCILRYPVIAAEAAPAPIALHNGSNSFPIGTRGETALAMLGHRDNFNAHGFDMLTLYIQPAAPIGGIGGWQQVSFFDGDSEAFQLGSSGGADCLLHDFRLVRQGGSDPVLLVAQRDLGASYADAAPVHFKQYSLHRNLAGVVGRPLYYFALDRSFDAAQPHCDVGAAFASELRLGAYRQPPD